MRSLIFTLTFLVCWAGALAKVGSLDKSMESSHEEEPFFRKPKLELKFTMENRESEEETTSSEDFGNLGVLQIQENNFGKDQILKKRSLDHGKLPRRGQLGDGIIPEVLEEVLKLLKTWLSKSLAGLDSALSWVLDLLDRIVRLLLLSSGRSMATQD